MAGFAYNSVGRHKLILCGSACSGLLPSLIGVCHVAVQFPLYEACQAKLAERAGTTVDNLDPLSVVSA